MRMLGFVDTDGASDTDYTPSSNNSLSSIFENPSLGSSSSITSATSSAARHHRRCSSTYSMVDKSSPSPLELTLEKRLETSFPTVVAVKKGILLKQGGNKLLKTKGKWQKRYIVLEPTGLKYFAYSGMTGKLDLRHSITFTTATTVEADLLSSDEYSFQLRPLPGARAYRFRCKDGRSLSHWLDAIQELIRGAKDLDMEHERVLKLFKRKYPNFPPFSRSGLVAVYHAGIDTWKTRLVTLSR